MNIAVKPGMRRVFLGEEMVEIPWGSITPGMKVTFTEDTGEEIEGSGGMQTVVAVDHDADPRMVTLSDI